MNLEILRKLVIQSLFTDDKLFNTFVLKGGNALLVHNINTRASIDIDVSMEKSFDDEDLDSIEETLYNSLKTNFYSEGYTIIELHLKKQPKVIPKEKEKYWGGYKLEFKVVSLSNEKLYTENQITFPQLRNLALSIEGSSTTKSDGAKTFKVDISKYEYCVSKIEKSLDGFPIYVYTPLALVYEKLRAICQQQKDYNLFVETNRRPRARDFFDIYTVIEAHDAICSNIKSDIFKEENLKDLSNIFSLKKVPLDFLNNIKNDREFHNENFISVKSTVFNNDVLESYDFYFDYTIKLCESLTEQLTNLNMMDNIPSNV